MLLSRFSGVEHIWTLLFYRCLNSFERKLKLLFCKISFPLYANVGIGKANVSQKGLIVFADPWFLVMTCYIVPIHSIIVELIEDSQAILGSAALNSLAIVRLRFADTKTHITQYRMNSHKMNQDAYIALSFNITFKNLDY